MSSIPDITVVVDRLEGICLDRRSLYASPISVSRRGSHLSLDRS